MRTSQLLLGIARAMPVGVITCNDAGGVGFVNAAALDVLRVSPTASQLDSLWSTEVGSAVHRTVYGERYEERLRRARLVTNTAVLRLVIGGSSPDGFVTLIVRRELIREGDLLAALTQELGIGPIEARTAVRAYWGLPNEVIADSFQVSVATIKSRLHRVYRRLRIRSRSELLPIIDRVVRSYSIAGSAPQPVSAAHDLSLPEPKEGTGALRSLVGFLEEVDFGIVALDADREAAWANLRARDLLGSQGWDALRESTRGCQLPAHVFVEHSRPRIDLRLFRLDAGGIGALVYQRRLRDESLRALLCDRFRLTDRQAEVASLLAAGSSTIEIAAATGLAEVSVRSGIAVLSEKLGVRGRAELTTLLVRIAEE